jgi:hypothetical protein
MLLLHDRKSEFGGRIPLRRGEYNTLEFFSRDVIQAFGEEAKR